MPASSVVVGIDVGKLQVEVTFLALGGAVARHANDGEGQTQLVAALQSLEAAPVVMKATGGYAAPLARALGRLATTDRIDATATSLYRRVSDERPQDGEARHRGCREPSRAHGRAVRSTSRESRQQ